MNIRTFPTNNPIIAKNLTDIARVLQPVVEQIFNSLRNPKEDSAEHKSNKFGKFSVVIDTQAGGDGLIPVCENSDVCETLAVLMNQLDPYDQKGLVFDEILFDINRPTWIDEHTSRFCTFTDADGMGPYSDDEEVESFRLIIDANLAAGYFTRILFIRSLIDELFASTRISYINVKSTIGKEFDDTATEEAFVEDVHRIASMFNRQVKFLSYTDESVTIVLHLAA